jgi:hypothetical protein
VRSLLLSLLLLTIADSSLGACKQKRNREPSFIELAVPDDAPRPGSVDDFKFVNDDTTIDQLIAKVGPPDASQGTSVVQYYYCFYDGTELRVYTRDRVVIDSIRYEGKLIFKRTKKNNR